MLRFTTTIAALLMAAACATPGDSTSRQETAQVVDESSAIKLARAAWIKAHPELRVRIGSEATWQKEMKATLRDGVWIVHEGQSEGEIGNGLVVRLMSVNGRILDIYLLQ